MTGQPNKFQFILNIRGIITEVLANAPEGWLNTAIKFTRSQTYKGIFRGETLPTKFVTRAAYLLRNEFYKYGVLGFVQVVINLLNPSTWLYSTIYTGRLDFSTSVDELASFTVTSISDDFTVKLNANDGTDYMIPIDVDAAVNLELTPLALFEQATFVPGAPPDGIIHSDYYPPMQLASYQQNGVNFSAQQIPYGQTASPNFAADLSNCFFWCRKAGKVKITGSINYTIRASAVTTLQMYIVNNSNTVVLMIENIVTTSGQNNTLNYVFNNVLNAAADERWFLYMAEVGGLHSNTGITINGGQIQLEYQTISPASMCKALPANYVFGAILQAMNTNTDSGPNQPVPFKSDLMSSAFLSELVLTCSDSIRQGLGTLVTAGQTVFPGSYKVVSGSILYGGATYMLGDTFPYIPGVLTFTGSGVIERVTSGFIGAVYNPGEDLQAGGTYLVGGNPGTTVLYNAITYGVGSQFTYVLGQTTFTGSDPTSFVQQVGEAIQLILNFKDFFQSVYSIMGGNCAFGIENGICFIEELGYVYRGSLGNLDAGKVDTSIQFKAATELIPNSIKVGYRDQQYSTLNGYAEVNSTQTYITNIVNPKKELNLVSAFRADPYGIEEVRVSQNDTAASRSNNDIFMVYKKAAPESTVPFTYYHPLRTEALTSIVGVDESYYNWSISPKSNLLRGAPYLASLFYNMGGYSLTLSAAPKNTAMVTVDSPFHKRVAEADPVLISSLGQPLFLPFYAIFKPGIQGNPLAMIDSVPYGFIRFTYNGTVYKMFAEEISVDVGQNTEQTFKGLMTPGNDLTTLIH